MTARQGLPAAFLLFALLATANSGGYRYGASDHAFYEAAIAERADPTLFPRDKPLLAAQSRLWVGDDLIGGIARVTGLDLPVLFAGIHALTLAALFAAGVVFMRALGGSIWATAAFLVLLTLRHRIAKTGANTLEGYMHPRMLAFALGVIALAAVVRGRYAIAFALLAATSVLHTTVALWFGVAVMVALGYSRIWSAGGRRSVPWRPIAMAAAVAGAIGAWALLAGPLAGRLAIMDPAWLAVLDSKDYLFPTEWPLYAWVTNLAYPVVLVLIHRTRERHGVALPGERAMLAGLLVLVLLFLIAVPLTAMHLALAVQMQVNRVFWVLDVVVAAYVAWWLADAVAVRWAPPARTALVVGLLAIAAARGVYVIAFEARRPLFEVRPQSAWVDAMHWIARQPERWHVLADPQHAWKYGVSVRVAAHRDTLLETSKDSALGMYDRAIAMQVAERSAALADFERLDTLAFRTLADRFETDVLVVEQPAALEFPVLYRNDRFTVYDLR